MPIKAKLIVLVILIAFVGGFLWYTKTPAPTDVPVDTASSTPTEVVTVEIPVPPLADTTSVDTSNWLTYTNTKYGYSLKYPPNLIPEDGGIGIEEVNETGSVIFVNSEVPGWRNDIVFRVEVSGNSSEYSTERDRVENVLQKERDEKEFVYDSSRPDVALIKKNIASLTPVWTIDERVQVYQYVVVLDLLRLPSKEAWSNVLGPYTFFDQEGLTFKITLENKNPISVAILKTLTFQTP